MKNRVKCCMNAFYVLCGVKRLFLSELAAFLAFIF